MPVYVLGHTALGGGGKSSAELFLEPSIARFTGQRIAQVLLPSTARFAGQEIRRTALKPRGTPTRVYRARIQAGSAEFQAVPVNWQGTFAADRANYLAVTIHNPPDDLLAAIVEAVDNEQPLTLTLESGFKWPTGGDYYSDLYAVNLQVLTDSIGATSHSTRLEGYREAPVLSPKAISISGTETLRAGTVAAGWRGVIDDRVNPGDLVTVADRPGLQFVVGNINYNVDARSGTMDISELTDAEILDTLPW